MNSSLSVTVALLTKNAATYLPDLLAALKRQQADFAFAILLLDSGSRDQTLAIARAHGGINIHSLPPAEFNHGRTRNLAMSLSRGLYTVFLTQDALPASDRWLSEIIAPFLAHPRLAGVFGRQLPRPDCNPLVARDLETHFKALYANQPTLLTATSFSTPREWERLRFFSNVNSALRRRAWEQIPFPEANYCEDQLWAEAALKAGYQTFYSPAAAVYHSHSFPFFEAFRRYYDEYLGLWEAFNAAPGRQLGRSLARALKTTLGDWRYLWRAAPLSLSSRFYYSLYSPVFNLARQLAAHLAYRQGKKGRGWESALSRDKHIKNS